MIICVDARPLVEKKVGFGFFLQHMLEAILEIDKDNEYILISDRDIFFDCEQYKNVRKINYKDDLLCPKTFYYYFKMSKVLKSEGIIPDVFWATNHIMPKGLPHKTKKVLTIHDFTHIKFPKATTKYNLFLSKLLFGPSIRNATHVICISKNTGNELKQYYPKEISDKNVSVVYAGGYRDGESFQECNLENVSEQVKKYAEERFILFVGTIEPRKNIKLLIAAAPRLKNICKVVVCGKIGWEEEQVVNKLQNTENLNYLNYITNDEKVFLMQHAFCQVQPSLYEGFGLPVVESMQAGTVVLVADNSSLSELVENNDLKFQTFDVNDFCNKVYSLLDENTYESAVAYCDKRGKFFTWRKAAEEYLEIWR